MEGGIDTENISQAYIVYGSGKTFKAKVYKIRPRVSGGNRRLRNMGKAYRMIQASERRKWGL